MGIEKILNLNPILKSYKNYKDETPLKYIGNKIINIFEEYNDTIIFSRLKNYGIIINNIIKNDGSSIY